MKAKFAILLCTLVVGTTIGLIAGTNVTPTPMQHRHPEIRKAIDALEDAKVYLKHADHDFGGHREKALIKADETLFELRKCMEY